MIKRVRFTAICLFAALLLLSGCGGVTPHTSADEPEPVLAAYQKFMRNESALHLESGDVNIMDLVGFIEEDYFFDYAYHDMNGDGIPELIIELILKGYIITYRDGELRLWHEWSVYDEPLRNGAIWHERYGAAWTHIDYFILMLDYYGDEAERVEFSCYDTDENDVWDYFLLDGEEVSQSEWERVTAPYFALSEERFEAREWQRFETQPQVAATVAEDSKYASPLTTGCGFYIVDDETLIVVSADSPDCMYYAKRVTHDDSYPEQMLPLG
jgi:uncharacterized protein YceK